MPLLNKSCLLLAGVCLAICHVPAQAQPVARAEGNAELRYELAQNRLFLRQGNRDLAYQSLLNAQAMGAGDEREYLLAVMDTCLQNECRKMALDAADKAESLYPDDAMLHRMIMRTRRAFGSRIGAGVSGVTSDNRSDVVFSANAEARIDNRFRVGVNTDYADAKGKDIVAVRTGVPGTISNDVYRGEIYGEVDVTEQVVARAQYFFNDEKSGVGGVVRRTDNQGAWQASAAFQQPTWDYAETITQSGTRDSVMLSREQILTSDLRAQLSVGLAEYEIDDVDAGQVWLLGGGLSYRLPEENMVEQWLGEDAYTAVSYGLSGRYVKERNFISSALVTNYQPIDLQDIEVHSVTFSAGKEISPDFLLSGYAGAGYERYDSSILPLAGGQFTYHFTKNWELIGKIDQSFDTADGGSSFTTGQLRLNWLY